MSQIDQDVAGDDLDQMFLYEKIRQEELVFRVPTYSEKAKIFNSQLKFHAFIFSYAS
jgi:hypothetical protein